MLPFFSNFSNSRELYRYLAGFGMYRPGQSSWEGLLWLQREKIWNKIEHLWQKYKKRWNGPEARIFIFPMNPPGNFGYSGEELKSGVTFPGKIVLFLGPVRDEKEIEALFIHEYHHVCRMAAQKKNIRQYTLLDSLVLEGTAEYTVEKLAGRKYRAGWCRAYSRELLADCWRSFIKKNLDIMRDNKLHDAILFGKGMFPKFIGYAVGYHLVESFFKTRPYSERLSFSLPPEAFLEIGF